MPTSRPHAASRKIDVRYDRRASGGNVLSLTVAGTRTLPSKLRRQLHALPGIDVDAFEAAGALEIPANLGGAGAVHGLMDALGLDILDHPLKAPSARLRAGTIEAKGWKPMWEPKTRTLFTHQLGGVYWLYANGSGLLADDMGLGKTMTSICAAQQWRTDAISAGRSKHAPVLIVGPRYARTTWANELRALGITDELFLCEGTTPEPPTSPFWFCHYEILKHWTSTFHVNRWGAPLVTIIDEVHWAKNPKSQRGQACRIAAGLAPHRVLLTGTPLPNRPRELWSALDMIEPGLFGSFFDFRKRYCGAEHDGYGYRDTRPTNPDELRDRIAHLYLRRTKDEVLDDLPPLVHQQVLVPLSTAKQERDHDQLMQQAGGMQNVLRMLEQGGGSTETFKIFHRLRKLTSKVKEKTTVELVQSLADQGQSTVVFCHERATCNRIAEKLQKRLDDALVSVVHGGYSQEARDEEIEIFQMGTQPRVLVATYGALREGVTLHAASQVVMHDLSWVPSDILQAEARIHRIGQKASCTSHWVICEGSFDLLMAQVLVEKARTQDRVLGLGEAKAAMYGAGFDSFAYGVDRQTQDLLATFEQMEGEAK